MNIIKNSLAAIAITSLAILGLAGCATPAASTPDPKASSASAPSNEDSTPAPEEDSSLHAFGDVVTYADGLSISVSEPAAFEPTQYAAGNDQASQILFEYVLTNNTGEPIDPLVFTSVSSAGVEASQIFDVDNPAGDVNSVPTTAVLDGQTIKWLQAYSIADPANLTVDVSIGFDYESSIFTNIPS